MPSEAGRGGRAQHRELAAAFLGYSASPVVADSAGDSDPGGGLGAQRQPAVPAPVSGGSRARRIAGAASSLLPARLKRLIARKGADVDRGPQVPTWRGSPSDDDEP
jgi:hypothetical protein